MFRVTSALGIAAATAAVVVLSSQVASASTTPAEGHSRVLGACAELIDQGHGWALLRNDCDVKINGTVNFEDFTTPACVPIDPHKTNTVYWVGDETATSARDCRD